MEGLIKLLYRPHRKGKRLVQEAQVVQRLHREIDHLRHERDKLKALVHALDPHASLDMAPRWCPHCGRFARLIWLQEHEGGCEVGRRKPLVLDGE